jgi:hypothetical protein
MHAWHSSHMWGGGGGGACSCLSATVSRTPSIPASPCCVTTALLGKPLDYMLTPHAYIHPTASWPTDNKPGSPVCCCAEGWWLNYGFHGPPAHRGLTFTTPASVCMASGPVSSLRTWQSGPAAQRLLPAVGRPPPLQRPCPLAPAGQARQARPPTPPGYPPLAAVAAAVAAARVQQRPLPPAAVAPPAPTVHLLQRPPVLQVRRLQASASMGGHGQGARRRS